MLEAMQVCAVDRPICYRVHWVCFRANIFMDPILSYHMYSESHCHLGDMTREALVESEQKGFSLLLSSGIDLASSEQAIEVAYRHTIAKACIGVHPWYADEYSNSVRERFLELADDPECVAVSEIGLDFKGRMTHKWVREDSFIDPRIQYEALDAQLGLARELSLPILVHDRASGMEILDMLERSGNVNTGIAIHGFSKDLEYARRCVDNGIYLSVGLRTMQSAEPGFIKAVKETPIEYLLTETDSAKPEGVITLCGLIGELKGMTREEVGTRATKNLMQLLGI
jgi:TatD DNase family protein